MEDYSKIFQSHIIRFYHEWGYSRQQFAEIIGISYGRTYSLLSEGGDIGLTLNTMQAISDSLGLPLPLLLKPLESEEWQSVLALWKWNPPYHSYIPDGYTLVRNVVLPEHDRKRTQKTQKTEELPRPQRRKRYAKRIISKRKIGWK